MENDINKKLEALYEEYAKNLPNKIQKIEKQWDELRSNLEPNKLKMFHKDIHSLCGSSGTYGYKELSQAARQLEIYLNNLFSETSSVITNQQIEEINRLLKEMKQAVHGGSQSR